jgi:hypothetical protein
MIRKNTTTFFIILLTFASFGFSVDIDFSTTVDTYADEFNGGPSITITGNLLDNLVLTSAIDYDKANTYDSFCQLVHTKKYFTLGSGLGFYFSQEDLYPTISLIGSIKPFNWFKLETQYKTGSYSMNFFSTTSSVNNLDITSYFYTSTADILYYFGYEKDTYSLENTYKNKFELLAHQEGVPLQINLFSELDTVFYAESSSLENIELIVGGGFQIDINTQSSYFVDTQITAISLEDTNQPFSIEIGAKYKIEDTYTHIKDK